MILEFSESQETSFSDKLDNMATNFEIRHEWNVPLKVVLEHLFDDALVGRVNSALESADRRLVSKDDNGGKVIQRYEVKAHASDIPAAARKVLSPETLQWTEESVWDPDNERFSWTIITKVMPEKIDCSGTVYYESLGSDRTSRIVEGGISIKIPIAGRVAEKVIIGKVKESFEDTGGAEGSYFAEMAQSVAAKS